MDEEGGGNRSLDKSRNGSIESLGPLVEPSILFQEVWFRR